GLAREKQPVARPPQDRDRHSDLAASGEAIASGGPQCVIPAGCRPQGVAHPAEVVRIDALRMPELPAGEKGTPGRAVIAAGKEPARVPDEPGGPAERSPSVGRLDASPEPGWRDRRHATRDPKLRQLERRPATEGV